MYVQHFGLKSRPFRPSATGPDVFVGPQTAKTMAALKKALDVPDAVVTVTGPVGVGKTTLVYRALNALGDSRIIISVGRMHLADDEVLELLLDELGTRQTPSGTVQRFSLFRRLLKGFADKGTRVFIVVEDASRIGSDALSELEALTAADAGVSDGANIVLMGEPGINELMKTPPLARLKQRVRLRESIKALNSGELRAYIKHWFRVANGDFDSLFADGAIELLHRHSGGIPRVINNTVETILGSAAEQKVSRITPEFITSVVAEECGITVQVQALTSKPPVLQESVVEEEPVVAQEPVVETVPVVEPDIEQKPGPTADSETPAVEVTAAAKDESAKKPQPKGPVEVLTKPEEEPAAAPNATATMNDKSESGEFHIPELIQDTLPNLSILSPELVSIQADVKIESESTPDPVIESKPEADSNTEPASSQVDTPRAPAGDSDIPALVFEGDADDAPVEDASSEDIPTLFSSTRLTHPIAGEPELHAEPVVSVPVVPKPESVIEKQPEAKAEEVEVPEWERDPTLAELRPDLEALERAMSYTQTDSADGDADLDDQPEEPRDAIPSEVVPEITLDRAIQEKIDEATELLKKTTIDLAEVTAAEEARVEAAKAAPVKLAAEKPVTTPPAKKDSGNNEELQKISSELSRAKTIEDVDDRMAETLFGEEFSQIAAQVAAHAAANSIPLNESANDDLQVVEDKPDPETAPLKTRDEKSGAAPKSKPVVRPNAGQQDDSLSATQRLRTVRELNGNFDPVPEPSESVVLSSGNSTSPPPLSGAPPESIEDQINTSMTQTLKALNVRPPPTISDDDDDDDGKSGFFSRFRRS